MHTQRSLLVGWKRVPKLLCIMIIPLSSSHRNVQGTSHISHHMRTQPLWLVHQQQQE